MCVSVERSRAAFTASIAWFAGLAGATALVLVPTFAQAATVLPQGGSVAAGSATIGTATSNTLDINQSSNRAIVNWQSYSIGQGDTVNYHQPSAASATLNRVTGDTPSSIAGTINAPGTVLLVNPNGIAITPSGVINTGSFAASTLDIKNSDFMSGNYKFTGNGASADVTNAGRIDVSDGGFAALLGGHVANDGTITARLGQVALGSGELITLDLAGDGFLSVGVPTKDLSKLKGADGKPLVSNTGKIIADDGVVELKAATAAGILRDAVNVPGSIQANSVGVRNGKIVLGGGAGGQVGVAGNITARGATNSDGGKVKVTGADINLSGTVDASTSGEWMNGGTVSVIADDTTDFSGTILAEGGSGGAGGTVETSGHTLDIGGGTVDAGVGGQWLLDPSDLTIDTGAASTIDAALGVGTSVALRTSGGTATESGVSGIGVVNTSGSGDIIIDSALGWSTGATLTLDAYRSIDINAPITVSGAGKVALTTNDGGSGGALSFGLSSSGFSGGIDYGPTNNGGELTINGATYNLLYTMPEVQDINTALNSDYALATSLDASSTSGWVPIGTNGKGTVENGGNGFQGHFEGLGHTISGLTFTDTADPDVGMFGYVHNGTIKNVGLLGGSIGCTVTGTDIGVGALVGWQTGGSASITRSYSTAAVNGTNGVTGSQHVGGLVGYNNQGTISLSYATGDVSGGNQVGGLVGEDVNGGTVSLSYATGAVSTSETGGGVDVGGLVGKNVNGSYIYQSYATGGTVSGGSGSNVGGLVGRNNASDIFEVYATGHVSGGADVGGLVGYNNNSHPSRSVTDYANVLYSYWDTETSGTNKGIGYDDNNQTVTPLTTSELEKTTVLSGLNNGSVAFADQNGQTTPYLVANPGPFYIVGSGTTLFNPISNVYQLQAINNDLSDNYALITNIDASATATWNYNGSGGYYYGFVPLGTDGAGKVWNGSTSSFVDFSTVSNSFSSIGFTGTFDGLGHTISGLNIDRSSSGFVGLFGFASNNANIRDVGLVGGSVRGLGYVGDLVGSLSGGTVNQAYATGAVSGSFEGVGGLVGGSNGGTISQSYATGAVSAPNILESGIGGLVGIMFGGTISQSYATGAVSGSAFVGGLVGGVKSTDVNNNPVSSSISQTYATGAVSGNFAEVGGLVGYNYNDFGTISHSYWDTETSGITKTTQGVGNVSSASGVTGLTTAGLQGSSLQSLGFDSTVWGTGPGLYPYLKWQYPTTPQAISGFAYSDAGVTALASGSTAYTVSALADGASVGSATTGANGYYYILAPGGTVTSGTALLAYSDGAHAGARLDTGADAIDTNGNVPGFDIWGSTLIAPTSATTYSGASATSLQNQDYSSLIAKAVGGNTDPTTGLTQYGYIATGGGFTIDQSLTPSNGLYVETTVGDITVNDPVTWSADEVFLDAAGSVHVNAEMTATSTAGLVFDTNQADAGGDYYIDAPVNLATSGSFATKNGSAGSVIDYTIIDSLGSQTSSNDGTLQGINGNLSGDYVLGANIDASGTSGWNGGAGFVPIGGNGSANFTGTFDGLGHTISSLTINDSTDTDVGLFGYVVTATVTPTIENVGLVGGSITGSANNVTVGSLVGFSKGIVAHSYSTATVVAEGSNSWAAGGLVGSNSGWVIASYATGTVSGGETVGGLVGSNSGWVIASYATGAVTGYGGSKGIGGLVGLNEHGVINYAYAMGAVTGSYYVGGLVGDNRGTISSAYATGAVTGSSDVGGLGGVNDSGGTISNSYWDTETTAGQTDGCSGAASCGSSTVKGLTTAGLQGSSLQSLGFDSTVWGTGPGLYPYLKWQYSTTPQAISGVAYSDAGTTVLASGSSGAVTVSALVDGTGIGSATTGANGYYYILAPGGTLTGTQQLLSYVNGNTVKANTYVGNASGNTTANLWGGWLRLYSDAGATSSMFSGLSTALGGNTGSDFLYGSSGITSGTSLGIVSGNASGLTIDGALDVGSQTISLDASGAVTQSAALTAGSLELLGSSASYTLDNSANAINTLAADTGALTLADNTDLAVGTVVNTAGLTSSGAVTLTTTGNFTIASGVQVTAGSGSDAVLAADGNFVNNEGSDAVSVSGGGRWLIYSNAPAADTFGDLNSGNTAIWDATYTTLPPSSVTESGNRYLFAYQPTLTVTTTDVSKTYGDDATAAVAAAFTVSGYEAGVGGAFLGDTASSIYSGTPSVISSGSVATAGVVGGPYAITASTGTLTMLDSYALAFSNTGTLTVDPATLMVTPNAVLTTYNGVALGNASYSDSIGSYSITGFVNHETVSTAGVSLSGSMAFNGSTTTSVLNAGTYSQGEGTLALTSNFSNYVMKFSNPAPNNYVIQPARLVMTPNAVSTTYSGVALDNAIYSNNSGHYSITGFVNHETVSTAGVSLSGSMAFNGSTTTSVLNAGTYSQGEGTLALTSNFSNYVMKFSNPAPNNYVIQPARLIASLTGTVEKTFDGNTVATLDPSNYDLGGIIGADIVTLNAPTTGSYDTLDPGTGKIVTVSGLALLGAESGNYTLSATTISGPVGTIDPAQSPYSTSKYESSGGNGGNSPSVNISFQNASNSTSPVITTVTPGPVASNANQNIATGGGSNSLFAPFSQFDPNQYTNDTLPGFAPQAGEATVLTMIARAEEDNRKAPKINALWQGNAGEWPSANSVLKNVIFSDGSGHDRTPDGDNGLTFKNGTIDIAVLLKHGPVMLGGATSTSRPPTTPWLLALKMTADGKGIIANDPLTGDQVILAYDPATKTVGGVTAVIDPKTGKPVPLGNGAPQLTGQNTKVPPAAWSELKAFKPISYFAVSI